MQSPGQMAVNQDVLYLGIGLTISVTTEYFFLDEMWTVSLGKAMTTMMESLTGMGFSPPHQP